NRLLYLRNSRIFNSPRISSRLWRNWEMARGLPPGPERRAEELLRHWPYGLLRGACTNGLATTHQIKVISERIRRRSIVSGSTWMPVFPDDSEACHTAMKPFLPARRPLRRRLEEDRPD